MPKKVVALSSADGHIATVHRYRWFDYVEEDAGDDEVPYRLRIRTNLSYAELDALRDDIKGLSDDEGKLPSDEATWPIIAPFVVDWNLSAMDSNGDEVSLPPPAEGGPEQFRHIPPALYGAIYRDIVWRRELPLARKTSTPSTPTPEP